MTEGTHLHLGLIRAWELWFQGKDIKGDDDLLWGIHLIWWSRLGVVTGLLGGLVVIFDIIGEEKLKRYGIKGWKKFTADEPDQKTFDKRFVRTMLAMVAMIVAERFFPLPENQPILHISFIISSVGFAIAFGMVTVMSVVQVALFTLKNGKAMVVARFFALAMLLISAHFTLLTS